MSAPLVNALLGVAIVIAVGALILFVVATALRVELSRLLRDKDTRADKATAKHTYACEVIDPRRHRRGACGILGCPDMRHHSHAEDLIRRLKEPRQ